MDAACLTGRCLYVCERGPSSSGYSPQREEKAGELVLGPRGHPPPDPSECPGQAWWGAGPRTGHGQPSSIQSPKDSKTLVRGTILHPTSDIPGLGVCPASNPMGLMASQSCHGIPRPHPQDQRFGSLPVNSNVGAQRM